MRRGKSFEMQKKMLICMLYLIMCCNVYCYVEQHGLAESTSKLHVCIETCTSAHPLFTSCSLDVLETSLVIWWRKLILVQKAVMLANDWSWLHCWHGFSPDVQFYCAQGLHVSRVFFVVNQMPSWPTVEVWNISCRGQKVHCTVAMVPCCQCTTHTLKKLSVQGV